jgi:hypothetical protein
MKDSWNKATDFDKRNQYVLRIFAVVVVLWVICGFSLYWVKDRGTIGDMFGTVNALFSGLAFAGIIITILLQRQELKLQRRELRLSRKEFSIQNQTLMQQRFENSFFSIYDIHMKTVDSFELVEPLEQGHVPVGRTRRVDVHKGKEAFFYLRKTLKPSLDHIDLTADVGSFNHLATAYDGFHKSWKGFLDRYVNSLMCVLEYIDNSELIAEIDKQLYFNIVLSHFPINEKGILYYHALLGMNYPINKRLRLLIYKRGLLLDEIEVLYHLSHSNLPSTVRDRMDEGGAVLI